jgi:carbonic anhydrase
MSVIDEVMRSNAEYAAAFGKGDLTSAPATGLAVVTCMDARIVPLRALGLEEGDAHVIRNAGGVVTDDVIRSLTLSQRKLGTTEVMVVMHTKCGLHGISDSEFRDEVQAEAGLRPQWETGGFPDLEQAVREGVAKLRATPFLTHKAGIRGFVYDVETGLLREVA